MLVIIKPSPCDELMQAGDGINIIRINICINSLHLFSKKFVLKYFIEISKNNSHSKLPISIHKFLGNSKMFSHFKLTSK